VEVMETGRLRRVHQAGCNVIQGKSRHLGALVSAMEVASSLCLRLECAGSYPRASASLASASASA
jgi:hypothetical protein